MAEAGGKASAKKRAENRREANARAEEEALLQQLRKNSKRKRLRDAHAHEQQLTAGLPPDD
ncbi:MAG TPA: hypothetical protein PK609_01760 [Candidatus Paceibacterota bacterium]|nr:hypothetical protein [Candidatus Paceibacterota bacterium]